MSKRAALNLSHIFVHWLRKKQGAIAEEVKLSLFQIPCAVLIKLFSA